MLMSRKRPLESDVQHLKAEVEIFEKQLEDITTEIYNAQRENHDLVEKSRARRFEHDSKVRSIEAEIKCIKWDMDFLNKRRKDYQVQAAASDVNAFQYEKKSRAAKEQSVLHVVLGGLFSGTAVITGAVLAPVTGGSSVAVAGAVVAGIYGGVNGAAAAVKYKEAKNADKRSCAHRGKAEHLRAGVRICEAKLTNKRADVKEWKWQSKELEAACGTLLEAEEMIYVFVETVSQVNSKITDFKVLMQNAVHSGDALRIMSAALGRVQKKRKGLARLFTRKPKKLSVESRILIEEMKVKWQDVVNCMSLGHREDSDISPRPICEFL